MIDKERKQTMKAREKSALVLKTVIPECVDTAEKIDKWIDIFIEDYTKDGIAIFDVIAIDFTLECEVDYSDDGYGTDKVFVSLVRNKKLGWDEKYRGVDYPECVQWIM